MWGGNRQKKQDEERSLETR